MSVFNPDTFLDETFTEANSTRTVAAPDGQYFTFIREVKPNVIQTKNGERPVLNVTHELVDCDEIKEALGREVITARQTIWLDLTDAGSLDFSEGKNVVLGKLRKALNQNTAGQSWSPRMLANDSFKIPVYVVKKTLDSGDEINEITKILIQD